jgi:hypothetical protein
LSENEGEQVRAPVVLILGAGAGVDLRMPTGRDLQVTISRLTQAAKNYNPDNPTVWGDPEVQTAVRRACATSETEIISALKQINEGVYLRASIDDFLDRHRANRVINACGKIVIARAILQYELESKLHFKTDNVFNTLDFNQIGDSWIIRFWQMLGQGTATEEIANSLDHITIINFNYDRCIEQFLIQALRCLDGWSPKDAHEFVYKQMRIFHPYGVVGKLPPTIVESGVAFGDEKPELVALGNGIKTYTEQMEEDDALKKIHHAMAEAETIIILGFHFHRQNVALLKPTLKTRVRKIYATVHGISNEDQAVVRNRVGSWTNQLMGLGAPEIHLVQGDCLQLFRSYEKTLNL